MKQVGYYHVFPFQEIEQGASVIIWGMGEVGQHYLKQVIQTGYCNIEYAVDKNWQNYKDEIVKVMPIFAVKRASEGVSIVIANGNAKAAKEIRRQLLDWGIADECIVWNDIIIGESMVVSDQPTQSDHVVKRIGYYHIFPFHRIEKNETIILWGMGEVGRHYALQLQKTGFAQVKYAVDSNWQSVKDAMLEVRAPGQIAKTSGIKIVIANGSGQAVDSIKSKLMEMGIEDERILWEDLIVESELVVQEKAREQKAGIPCLYGSESRIVNRQSPNQCAFYLCTFDVVSFNVFDVLVFRCFKDRNVFYEIVGEKMNCRDFPNIRSESEVEARRILDNNRELRDVSLEDIYEIVERKTGISAKYGCEKEIETEIEWSLPNPYYQDVYNAIRYDGKKIIFLEDTHLGKEALCRILLKCGYPVEKNDIFSSCECFAKKARNGSLFSLAMNVIGAEKNYCHVGHVPSSDVQLAKKRNFNTCRYLGVHDIGNRYRASDMSEIVGEAYKMLVNRELHQDEKDYSVPYEYGFIYGGLLVTGTMQWLSKRINSHIYDKVVFLSSDGPNVMEIYKKVDLFGVEVKYLYWSEIVGLHIMADKERNRFINKFLYDVSWEDEKITIKEYFNRLHLEQLLENNKRYPFHLYQEMDNEIAHNVANFMIDHWNELVGIFEQETKVAEQYVRSVVGDSDRLAIVDLSNYGENAYLLAEAIKEQWNFDCYVDIFTVGSRMGLVSNGSCGEKAVVDNVYSYCFNRTYQKNLYDFHFNANPQNKSVFFSMLWSQPKPELVGFSTDDGKVKLDFAKPVVENYEVLSEIQNGIYDFCQKYLKCFSGNKNLMDISGADAYMPFKFVAGYIDYYKNNWRNYLVATNLSTEWTQTVSLDKMIK